LKFHVGASCLCGLTLAGRRKGIITVGVFRANLVVVLSVDNDLAAICVLRKPARGLNGGSLRVKIARGFLPSSLLDVPAVIAIVVCHMI